MMCAITIWLRVIRAQLFASIDCQVGYGQTMGGAFCFIYIVNIYFHYISICDATNAKTNHGNKKSLKF